MNENFITNYINKVRAKSSHEREVLAFTWAVGVTGLIAVLWVINTVYLIDSPSLKTDKEVAVTEKSSWQNSLTANIALVGDGWKVVRQEFNDMLKK